MKTENGSPGRTAGTPNRPDCLPNRPDCPQKSLCRLAVSPAEAAELLGVSRDFFDDHIRPELNVIRRGRLVLIPRRELERWLDENASSIADYLRHR